MGAWTVPATALVSWEWTGTAWGRKTSPLRPFNISCDMTPLTMGTCPPPSGHPLSKWQEFEPGALLLLSRSPTPRTVIKCLALQPAVVAVPAGRRGQEGAKALHFAD